MNNQKIGNLLNLAMDATPGERQRSLELDVGFERLTRRLDVVIRYSGDIDSLASEDILITKLLGNYAVVNLPQELLEEFSRQVQVEFVEKPKRLFFAAADGRAVSCINVVQNQGWELFGKGFWWPAWIPASIIPIRIFGMKMEAAGFCGCGTRRSPEIIRRVTGLERSIRKSRSIRPCGLHPGRSGRPLSPAGIPAAMVRQ